MGENMPPPQSSKRCPYCRERISATAARCRFCGERVEEEEEVELEVVEEAPPPKRSAIRQKSARPAPIRSRPLEDEEDDEDEEERQRRPKRRRSRGAYASCPECGCPGHADKVGFTWWGGLIGPAILCHVRCRKCNTCYNGRSGESNSTAIIIYTVCVLVLSLVLVGVAIILNH
jgi:hypothetical protein